MSEPVTAFFQLRETESGVEAEIEGAPNDLVIALATYLSTKPDVIPIFETAIKGARKLIADQESGKIKTSDFFVKKP